MQIHQPQPSSPPHSGFELLVDRVEAEAFYGPYFADFSKPSAVLGFRVSQRHLNALGRLHGGLLATFLDVAGAFARRELGAMTFSSPTISLNIDYFAPIPEGAWVSTRPNLDKATRRMMFVSMTVGSDGVPSARCSAIYRLMRPSS